MAELTNAEVLKRYERGNLSQRELATALGLSQSKVARMLKAGRAERERKAERDRIADAARKRQERATAREAERGDDRDDPITIADVERLLESGDRTAARAVVAATEAELRERCARAASRPGEPPTDLVDEVMHYLFAVIDRDGEQAWREHRWAARMSPKDLIEWFSRPRKPAPPADLGGWPERYVPSLDNRTLLAAAFG